MVPLMVGAPVVPCLSPAWTTCARHLRGCAVHYGLALPRISKRAHSLVLSPETQHSGQSQHANVRMHVREGHQHHRRHHSHHSCAHRRVRPPSIPSEPAPAWVEPRVAKACCTLSLSLSLSLSLPLPFSGRLSHPELLPAAPLLVVPLPVCLGSLCCVPLPPAFVGPECAAHPVFSSL